MARRSTPANSDTPTIRTTLRASLLLRVHEERVEHVRLRYEVLDLAAGESRSFSSLAALQRWLAARERR